MKFRPTRIFLYLFLLAGGFISALPFVYMALAGTNESINVVKGKFFLGAYTLENAKVLFDTYTMGPALLNSAKIAIIGTLLTLFVCSLAGYGFQIYRSKAKDRLMSILLLSMMVPFASIMVPLFRMFSQWKLLSTTMGIVLPSVATAFMIFFFRQNSASFPMEIVQAARVDGLSEFGIYLRIYVPVMSSTFAAAAIIVFMGAWNNYLWPLVILLKKESRTWPIIMAGMTGEYVIDYGVLMLGVTLCTIPTLLIFITQQRRFVSGILGSVK